MAYILVVITVFSSAVGVDTETRFQDFETMKACQAAKRGIEAGVARIAGTLGRDVFAACYPRE